MQLFEQQAVSLNDVCLFPTVSSKHKEIIMAFNMKNRHLLSLVHHMNVKLNIS